MKRLMFMGIVLATASWLISGCAEEGDDGDDDDASGGSSSGNPNCDPAGDGVCETDQDCPKVISGIARSTSATCGQSCLDQPDPDTCTVGCIVDQADLSTECAICYAGAVGCAAENCLAECANTPTADECTQCQIDAGCRADFDMCSGLETPMQ